MSSEHVEVLRHMKETIKAIMPSEVAALDAAIAALSAQQPPAEAQPDWEVAPPGATHYQPHQGAYYKRVSASKWYVWSREDDREVMRWLPSLGTRDNAEWVVRPAEAQPVGDCGEAGHDEGRCGNASCAPPSAPVGVEGLVRDLVREIERNTCAHEDTHRGGAIWEICDACGARWADDRGGKPDFKWPDCVERAHAYLAQQPAAMDEAMVEAVRALAKEWRADIEASDMSARADRRNTKPKHFLRDLEKLLKRHGGQRDAQQPAASDELTELVRLLDEVRSHFTRDDDLPGDLLPRIDAALRDHDQEDKNDGQG